MGLCHVPQAFAFRTISNKVLCGLSFAAWLGLANVSVGQSPGQAGIRPPDNSAAPSTALADPARAKTQFDIAADAMREHIKQMRQLAVEYHLTDTPAQARPIREQWIKFLNEGRSVHDRMVEAALADYASHPSAESREAQFLYQVAARNADADRFDGMLPVLERLKDSGFTAQSFDLCFGLTAAASNQFAAALPFLEKARSNLQKGLEDLGKNRDLNDEQREKIGAQMFEAYGLLSELSQVEAYQSLWDAEQKAREQDAQGEPLPQVLIHTTKGDFVVELYENQAPNTVANFISLCEKGFYDGLPFHRVLTHFMAQGGCPNRDGSGDPGYSIPTELDGSSHRNFFRGTLGMALSNTPDSGGSQFFVCYMPRMFLNGKYVAFGRVIEGMNVLSDLTHIDPEKKDKEAPADPPDEIVSTKVLRKRDHPYTPKTIPAAK